MTTLTNNEQVVLKAIVENAHNVGDSSIEFIMSDVAKMTDKSQKSIQGVCSSLQKKGFIQCYNCEAYFDGEIRPIAEDWYNESSKTKNEEIVWNFLIDNYRLNGITIDTDTREIKISDKPNKDGKYVVDVNGGIYVKNKDIDTLTNDLFVFGKVSEYFDCYDCYNLTSLEGAPKEVVGCFNCIGCINLTTLEGAPEEVRGGFSCDGCEKLKNLDHLPKKIGGLLYVPDHLKKESIMKTLNDFYKPAVDERIVRLNEILNTKLSSVSRNKRELLKIAKTAAKYILENWDNAELGNGGLKVYINDDEMKAKNEELHKIAESRYNQLVKLAAKEIEEKMKNAAPKAETTTKSTASNKSGKTTSTTKKTSGTARKVGDHHPTKPWIWTEYAPGKFDWRIDKTMTGEKKAVAKKNKTTKKVTKKSEQITTEEFISITKKNKRNLSATQEEYLKLLKKGYWIWNNDGSYFFKNEAGKMKQCNMDSLKSLFKKFNIEEIPSCLIR